MVERCQFVTHFHQLCQLHLIKLLQSPDELLCLIYKKRLTVVTTNGNIKFLGLGGGDNEQHGRGRFQVSGIRYQYKHRMLSSSFSSSTV